MSCTPIFLFSLPRSGSTLLQRMLACHQDIQSQSELWFLLPHIDALLNRYSQSLYSANSLKNATQYLVTQLPNGEEDYYEAIRNLAQTIYDKLAVNHERYVLDKTPRYYLIVNEIERLFPNAKFVFLFRHPFAVSASTVKSFHRNKLGDYRHRIDLFEGPLRLAESYRNFQASKFSLKYENLVEKPEKTLLNLCDYLDIPYDKGMVSNFLQIPVVGLGDQFGSAKYSRIDQQSKDKWKKVFATPYRKKYLRKILLHIGSDTVQTFGYDYKDLEDELDDLSTTFSLSIEDRLRELLCKSYSLLEIPILTMKMKKYFSSKSNFYIHH